MWITLFSISIALAVAMTAAAVLMEDYEEVWP